MIDPGMDQEVSEQWTTSRAALVLSGSVSALVDVARQLALPTETIVEIRRGEAVLALWGEPLAAYQCLRGGEPTQVDQRSAH